MITPEIADVRPWTGSGKKIRAFCSVRIGDVTIHDVRLIEGEKGPFVTGPATQSKNGRWNRNVSFTPELANKILIAIETALGGDR